MSFRALVAVVAVSVVVFAVALEAGSMIRLDQSRAVRDVSASPGQLLEVRINGAWTSLTSSDEAVVKPIWIRLQPTTLGYFLAAKPGSAFVRATFNPCPTDMPPPRCLALEAMWAVRVDVR